MVNVHCVNRRSYTPTKPIRNESPKTTETYYSHSNDVSGRGSEITQIAFELHDDLAVTGSRLSAKLGPFPSTNHCSISRNVLHYGQDEQKFIPSESSEHLVVRYICG
jgi:hypothetical protein